jgi:hypothetical protein
MAHGRRAADWYSQGERKLMICTRITDVPDLMDSKGEIGKLTHLGCPDYDILAFDSWMDNCTTGGHQ